MALDNNEIEQRVNYIVKTFLDNAGKDKKEPMTDAQKEIITAVTQLVTNLLQNINDIAYNSDSGG